MKKFFLCLLTLFLLSFNSFALARTAPTISSDKQNFNPFTGVYNLVGNVMVRFPSDELDLIIKGDRALVYLYKLEVHAQGNIELGYDEKLSFICDTVDVYHSKRTAYVTGNTVFKCGKDIITADKGEYCWKTKLAVFRGNVTFNGKAHPGDIEYHVLQEKITKG